MKQTMSGEKNVEVDKVYYDAMLWKDKLVLIDSIIH